eukprot:SAG11_NODE_44_length_20765_cov_5.183635_7_plen_60_part_00
MLSDGAGDGAVRALSSSRCNLPLDAIFLLSMHFHLFLSMKRGEDTDASTFFWLASRAHY